MSVELKYPHIVKPEDRPAHLERFPRVRVAQIAMDYLGRGWSAVEIAKQYPHLTLAETHAALLYYFDHREEIDQEIRKEQAQIEESMRGYTSPLRAKLQAKGLI